MGFSESISILSSFMFSNNLTKVARAKKNTVFFVINTVNFIPPLFKLQKN